MIAIISDPNIANGQKRGALKLLFGFSDEDVNTVILTINRTRGCFNLNTAMFRIELTDEVYAYDGTKRALIIEANNAEWYGDPDYEDVYFVFVNWETGASGMPTVYAVGASVDPKPVMDNPYLLGMFHYKDGRVQGMHFYNDDGGGGGGYTVLMSNISVTPGETLSVTIGAGGIAPTDESDGCPGGATGIKRGSTTLAAVSGGNGGKSETDGGSGCGGCGCMSGWVAPGGNGGADGSDGETSVAGAPGGTGQHLSTRCPFNGNLYAGGGGGVTYNATGSGSSRGAGGAGGGGNAGNSNAGDGANGAANTGGGGGAGTAVAAKGGNGGSGVVILRYAV